MREKKEKKTFAGYIAGLVSMGVGGFVASQAGLLLLEATLDAGKLLTVAPTALPVLVGSLAVAVMGGRTIINTIKGNMRTNMNNDIKEIKEDVKEMSKLFKEELKTGIDKTPIPTAEKNNTPSKEQNVRE